MKRNYVFSLLVGLLLIFTLTACGEKIPTKCPSYIDLSLDRELELFDKIERFGEVYDKREFYPEGVYIVGGGTQNGTSDGEIIYITSDDVLYLVDYRMREVDGEILRYVTKIAYRKGDKYIYKVDNWSGSGLMVAEYCNVYYDYFNEYEKSKAPSIYMEMKNVDDTVKVPKNLDLNVKTRIENVVDVLEISFNDSDNPFELAQEFVPKNVTVYSARDVSENVKEIIYITADGVCYRDVYSGDKDDCFVRVYATSASDNCVYLAQVYYVPRNNIALGGLWGGKLRDVGDVEFNAEPKQADDEMVYYLDLWRADRGLLPQPVATENSSIYRAMPYKAY